MENAKLQELVQCPVCHDVLSTPIILPCSHTLCYVCWYKTWDGWNKKYDILFIILDLSCNNHSYGAV